MLKHGQHISQASHILIPHWSVMTLAVLAIQMRKVEQRYKKQLAQEHTGSKWLKCDQNAESSKPL